MNFCISSCGIFDRVDRDVLGIKALEGELDCREIDDITMMFTCYLLMLKLGVVQEVLVCLEYVAKDIFELKVEVFYGSRQLSAF